MADFGLAAQIGRGTAMSGAQQQDPQNRMMQMMQMQQLQQNMMLAREQEMRAAQLYPLQVRGKEAELTTEGLRQNLLGSQGRRAGVDADTAQMDFNARRGVVEYLAANSTNPRNPRALATLAAANPLAHDELVRRFGQTDEIRAKAGKEGALSLKAQNELAQNSIANMSWAFDAVQNPREFQTLRSSLVALDPTAADYIPEEFSDEAKRRMGLRLNAWKDTTIEEDEGGRKYLTNKRTGGRRYLSPIESATAPAEGTIRTRMGIAPEAFEGSTMAAPEAARAAAPIIQPRAETFEGLSPRAAAKAQETMATKSAESASAVEERKRSAREVLTITSTPEIDKLIARSTSGAGQRMVAGAYEAITGQSTKGQEAIGQLETVANKIALDLAGGKLGAGISNDDREFLLRLLGNVADPNRGSNQRVAAFRQFREGLKALEGGKPLSIVPGSASPTATPPDVDALLKKYP